MKKAWLSLFLTLSLTGCALAPGQRVDPLPQRFIWKPTDNTVSSVAVETIPISPELLAEFNKAPESVGIPPEWLGSNVRADYRINARDVLVIALWGHPELNLFQPNIPSTEAAGVVVDDEGYVAFPFAGKVKAAGLSVGELRDELTTRLTQYFKDPQINIRIADFRSRRVYVDGEVRQPGLVFIRDTPLTLAELISRSGGLTPAGDLSRVSVIRSGKTQEFNVANLLRMGLSPDNIVLRHGDVVRVPSLEETKVAVIGEVNKPLTLPMRNGRLSLGEALNEALGISALTGDARQVYVVRSSDPRRAQVYHLDASNISSLVLANAFPLQPRDVVYVDAEGAARFNRVLGLILPSVQSFRSLLELQFLYRNR